MKYFQLVILIFARTAFGQCDEDEVEIWGNCYDISSTYELDLSSSGINDTIPWEIGSLLNLFSINLSEKFTFSGYSIIVFLGLASVVIISNKGTF